MTLPVSTYEELLARVRSLTHETIQLQRELTTPLVDHNENERSLTTPSCCDVINTCDNGERDVDSSSSRSFSAAEDTSSKFGGAHGSAWIRRSTRNSSSNTHYFQNESVHSKVSAASFLARFGLKGNVPDCLVRERSASLLSGGLVINNKENVMEEPKEEDEKKTAEVCAARNDDDDDNSSEEDGIVGAERDSKVTNSGTQTHPGLKPGKQNLSTLYHGTWPVERTLWHSGPSSLGGNSSTKSVMQDVSSVMSFTSSLGSTSGCLLPDEVAAARRTYSQQQLGAKVEMVYNLLSMLGTHDREDMSRTLLAMSSSPDSCAAMRQSGCLPLLVQLLHAPDSDTETRQRAAQALHNMVHSHPDDKRGRREARVLRLLEQVREYCESLREMIDAVAAPAVEGNKEPQQPILQDDMERHPGPTIAALMKLSFDEEHRHAMCQLGGLHAVAELIQVDHEAHGSTTSDQYCVTLRRYAGMALTNLTFGDGANKALLCSFRPFMKALVAQLKSPSEDLRQVTASVLRNLSWRADGASKQTLREVGAVSGLMQAAMEGKKESTLKSILSALWNLSAHCSINKVDICAVEGALGFLVDMLSYKAPSKTLAIVENAGGILRNISSHIAVREDYRAILREHNCLQVLLQQLKSPSLTIVSNACGTLWNLSARCAEDQRALWEMGAVSMLRSLVHSKHKMISMGSSAALKNLLSAKPNNNFPLDSTAKGLCLPALPSLYVRKQRALEQELDQSLSETCDNIEPSTSPSSSTLGLCDDKFVFTATEHCFGSIERRHSRIYQSQNRHFQQQPSSSKRHSKVTVARSDSRDSVTSTLSDTVYERVSRTVINPLTFGQASTTNETAHGLTGSLSDSGQINSQMVGGNKSERQFLHRYCNSMREREESRKVPSVDIGNDKGTPQNPNCHDLSYQSSQLEQINETNFSDPVENSSNLPTTREKHLGPCQSSTENTKHLNERREGNDERLGNPSLKSSSSTKQPKSFQYDNSRSTFTTLVSGSFGNSNTHSQYQHQTQQQDCMSTVRAKYSDFAYGDDDHDDAEVQEQPVDYSLKYVEDGIQTTDSAAVVTDNSEGDRDRGLSAPSEFPNPGNNSGKKGKQNQNDLGRGYPFRHQGNTHVSKNMKMNVVYGDYAETDLDQPTDYSLKYAEDEETEFEKNCQLSSQGRDRQERNYYDGNDPMHEDTLKTYCTEGTPYETPYNFSTATSMSDLQCEPATPLSENSGVNKQPDNFTKDESVEDNVAKNVENGNSSFEVESNFDKDFTEKGAQVKALPCTTRQPLKRIQSGISSGLISPEKPVQYCEEGTPGCFSCVSSLSSLNGASSNVDNSLQNPLSTTQVTDKSQSDEPLRQKPEGNETCSVEENEIKVTVKLETESSNTSPNEAAGHSEDLKEQHRGDREGKVVTFGGADHYAEETPLMFSRCSSLGSLSSFEQHSIHDDRSSIISDFSRRTSGIVSPSELPDSPTQTVPASPRHTKPPVDFTLRLEESDGVRTQSAATNKQQAARISSAAKGSVFEDNVVAFKEEDTPVEFSRTTSLSSLSIDDEPKISDDAVLKEVVGKPPSHPRSTGMHHTVGLDMVGKEREEGMEKQDVEKEKRGELADCCELAPVSEGEEENDEDMLAACINIGMQNSRQRQCQYNIGNSTKNGVTRTRQTAGCSRFHSLPSQSHTTHSGRPSGIPVKTLPNNNMRQVKGKQPDGARAVTSKALSYVEIPKGACEDAVQTYCTEGTPANISHAGSHSDLSVLSLPGDRDETEVQREETDENKGEEHPGNGGERLELSDDSSNFSGDNDSILAECIQSGMPKARNQAQRRVLLKPGSFSISSQSEQQPPPPPPPPQQQQQQQKKKKIVTAIPGVSVSSFTPRQQAASSYKPPAHHLCSLDHGRSPQTPPQPVNKKPAASCTPRPKVADKQKTVQHPSASGIKINGPHMLPQCLAAKDELETYATEGSPNTFSVRSSLSDLTINSSCGGTQRASCIRPVSEEDSCDIPLDFNNEVTPLEISHAGSPNSLIVGDDNEEEDFKGALKTVHESSGSPRHNSGCKQPSGIPVPVSRTSDTMMRTCMSPLHKVLDTDSATQLMVTSDGSWGDHSDKHEDSTASSRLHNKTSSMSEDMITVLSRNGSLSSLSVDSFGSTEPTPSEQALLEQCISSGMPKSKTEVGCGKPRTSVQVTKKKLSSGICKIPHRQGEEEHLGFMIPSVPMQKLELKPIQRTTHSIDNETIAGALDTDMTCLPIGDEDMSLYPYDTKDGSKNGVNPSAALYMMETAADVDENVMVIESEQNPLDPLENREFLENVEVRETISSHVSAIILENEVIPHDDTDVKHLQLTKPIELKVATTTADVECKLGLDFQAETTIIVNNEMGKSHENVSDEGKSPFSSEESPTDFGSDGKVEKYRNNRKDADKMIASLDRLTEELVQQAQDLHLQKDKDTVMKQSAVGSDTWNEDTSPNDVSFPSMSISAPLVASFRSDNHEDGTAPLPELIEEDVMSKTDEQQINSLTDSHMIELEASKLAVAVQAEAQNFPYTSTEEMEHSLTSLNSMDLDAIKPPSMMESLVSLTTSLSGQLDNVDNGETREHCNSSSQPHQQPRNSGTRLECRHSRKKSLPVGMMVRRAIGNNHNGSIENLQDNTSVSSSCNSHLDNIKPPSAMEELIDIADMENSMVSVASITSEVADSSTKEQSNSEQSPGNSDAIFELLKPAASVMAEVYAAHYPAASLSASVRTSSASDCLDNINPPSAFNEIAELADPESTMEPGTETICSDTEMYTEEPGYAHSIEKLDEVDAPDLPSDISRKTTPVPSDHYATSSAESTPKKHKHKQLTPKQKRELVKERYKTYTIAAEEERKKEIAQACAENNVSASTQKAILTAFVNGACGQDPMEAASSVQEVEKEERERSHAKITPKQRRIEDRERFQTRVLDKSPVVDKKHEIVENTQENYRMEELPTPTEEIQDLEHLEPKCNDTPKQRISRVKTLKQKRAEAKERFRTHTLSEENKPQQYCETNDNQLENANYETSECMQAKVRTETLTLNCSEVGFVEALLNVTPDEIETLLEHDANIVITTINDSKRCNSESSELPSSEEMLLECETLSLISLESESDLNSNICRMGKRQGSDHVGRESSVSGEPVLSSAKDDCNKNVDLKLNEEIEVEIEDEDSESDGEENHEEDESNTKAARGPRIVKPAERLKRDESADSNNADEITTENNPTPKAIRGRRKALYSSPSGKRNVHPGLPVATKAHSSIPVVSVSSKNSSPTNIRGTRASALRQTGKNCSSQRSVSKVSASSESKSPRNTSPKISRTARAQQRNPNASSPQIKNSSAKSSNSSISTTGKGNEGNEDKDSRFKPPERQGTFTKDDNSSCVTSKVDVNSSPIKTRIPIPSSVVNTSVNVNVKTESKLKKAPIGSKSSSVTSAASRSKLRKETSAPVPLSKPTGQSRFMKTLSQDSSVSNSPKALVKAATIPGRNGTTRSPPSSRMNYKRASLGSQDGMKTSVSNQSLQSNDSGKATPKQGIVHPQRSNSNCSLNSVSSVGGSSKKIVSKKEVTSKIAGLWKRVEESKNKQKAAKPDTRVWITAKSDDTDHIENENHDTSALTSRLVRSSTFEGLPSVSANKDEIEQKLPTDVSKVNKTSLGMEHCDGKVVNKSSFNSGLQRNQEHFLRFANTQKQVAEVTGVVMVHPTSMVAGHSLTKAESESIMQEVVLRRKKKEVNSTTSENEDSESGKLKRVSRLGSFIRIDPPEEGDVSNDEAKSTHKHPASAIVQPFNYNPPTSHIPMPVTPIAKRSEVYLNGISMHDQARQEQTETLEEHVQEFNRASMRVTTV